MSFLGPRSILKMQLHDDENDESVEAEEDEGHSETFSRVTGTDISAEGGGNLLNSGILRYSKDCRATVGW